MMSIEPETLMARHYSRETTAAGTRPRPARVSSLPPALSASTRHREATARAARRARWRDGIALAISGLLAGLSGYGALTALDIMMRWIG